MIHRSYNPHILKDKEILFHGHLGLGDHIVLNGMINHIAELQNKNIYILCKPHNMENVKRLHAHLSNVKVISTQGIDEHIAAHIILTQNGYEYLRIGHEMYDPRLASLNNWDCGQVFYHLANIPYEYRFSKFKFSIDEKVCEKLLHNLNPNNESFIFIHDDPNRGFNISNPEVSYKIIKNDIKYSILDYVFLLKNAKEIHLMPSSFYCLIESIEDIKAKLFIYNIRNASFGNVTKYIWNFVD